MEDLESFWTFHESIAVDELIHLKQKLQYTTYELELAKKETSEEIRKSSEHIKQLLQLIQSTCKERDEAKAQLKKFQQIIEFNKFNNNNNNNNNIFNDYMIPTTPFSPNSPLLTTKTNSSITESSSFSLETQTNNTKNNNFKNNQQFHVESPVMDSLDSIDSSNVVNFNTHVVGKPETPKKPTIFVDQESLIIANLAKGRSLPTKGQFLQAVIEAGPLLSTLMVAGSLPQWRNPPGVLTHQIPPVNLKVCSGPGPGSGLGSGMGSGPGSGEGASSGSIGVCQNSMLDFGSGSCFMGGRMVMNSGVGFDCQISKRQRII